MDFFGGEIGFAETVKRDKIKNNGALLYKIPLVRIPYYKKNTRTLEDLLGDDFIVKL